MEDKQYAEKLINKYSEKQPTKLDELKALDKKVKKPAQVFAYVFGSVSSLVLGTGMCLAMNIIGKTTAFMVVGIVVGLIGIAMVSSTYAIYKKMLNKRKQQYSSEIIKKSNELLNN
ncbi:MAG: dihydropteridine reductase [Clostridia bacterium]|nr:dihydropteridine reductase [Clostridia bacterium]